MYIVTLKMPRHLAILQWFILIFHPSIGELVQDQYGLRYGITEPNMTESQLVTGDVTSPVQCVLACAVRRCCMAVSYDSESGQCRTSSRAFQAGEGGQLQSSLQFYDLTPDPGWADCHDVGVTRCSGVFTVTPVTGTTLDVYCDMDTPGGPWTVIQNRFDGSVDFKRSWMEYKDGFGHPPGEFWLGMEWIRSLLVLGQALRITLEGWNGEVKHADYTTFDIGTEAQKYVLTLQNYGGTLNNAMSYHNGKVFSTFDRDNDNAPFSCSDRFKGAWWYGYCHSVNLFGLYVVDTGIEDAASMTWKDFYTGRASPPLQKCKMMIKRL